MCTLMLACACDLQVVYLYRWYTYTMLFHRSAQIWVYKYVYLCFHRDHTHSKSHKSFKQATFQANQILQTNHLAVRGGVYTRPCTISYLKGKAYPTHNTGQLMMYENIHQWKKSRGREHLMGCDRLTTNWIKHVARPLVHMCYVIVQPVPCSTFKPPWLAHMSRHQFRRLVPEVRTHEHSSEYRPNSPNTCYSDTYM